MSDLKPRHWCATFFTEPTNKLPEGVRYAIYGKEICPTTNKEHWQSYIEFTKPVRMAAVKKIYGDKTVHLEARQGSRDEARSYCKKDDKWEEHGEWITGQGYRTDLKTIHNKIVNGATVEDIVLNQDDFQTYCQYRGGIEKLAEIMDYKLAPAYRANMKVTVISGSTRQGKTKKAVLEYKPTFMIKGSKLQWWGGYSRDKVICIDEYNNNLPIEELLDILDGNKLRLDVKGGHRWAYWEEVVITTNLKKHQFHADAKPAHRAALSARITNWIDLWDEEVQGNTRPGPLFS